MDVYFLVVGSTVAAALPIFNILELLTDFLSNKEGKSAVKIENAAYKKGIETNRNMTYSY